MADHVSRIASAVSLPVIADADTGLRRARRTSPAPCASTSAREPRRSRSRIRSSRSAAGTWRARRVIPRDEMVRKVRAALAARANPDTVIIARTDAIAVTGLDDAIDRMLRVRRGGRGRDLPGRAALGRRDARDRGRRRGRSRSSRTCSEHGKTPLLSQPRRSAAARLPRSALYPTTSLFAAAQSAREIATACSATARAARCSTA